MNSPETNPAYRLAPVVITPAIQDALTRWTDMPRAAWRDVIDALVRVEYLAGQQAPIQSAEFTERLSPTIVDADGLPQLIAAVMQYPRDALVLCNLYAFIDTWAEKQRNHAVALAAVPAQQQASTEANESLIAAGALRQLRHNDGSEGFVFAYDKEITDRVLAQKNPGATLKSTVNDCPTCHGSGEAPGMCSCEKCDSTGIAPAHALTDAEIDPRKLTYAAIRKALHKYSRFMGNETYSDTEFACLQDVIGFAKEIERLAHLARKG